MGSFFGNSTKKGNFCLGLDPKESNKYVIKGTCFHSYYEIHFWRNVTSNIFSTLAASAGFWQLPLEKNSRHLCTFRAPCRRFYFCRLPFGLHSASEVFHKYIQHIWGHTWRNMMRDLRELWKALDQQV